MLQERQVKMPKGIKIIGVGHAAGDRLVTNNDMTKIVETSDSWIREKSGIRARHFAEKKSNEDMASEAAVKAIEMSGVDPKEISVCIIATFTADFNTPAMACNVAKRAGLGEEIIAFDLNGACTGFIFGCNAARGLMSADGRKYALVVGSEKISPFMDMKDRGTCVLFGDGAGAAVIELDNEEDFHFYSAVDANSDVLSCSRVDNTIKMSGQEVYRFAVKHVPICIGEVLKKSGDSPEDIDWFVCHQANERIIDNAARRTGSKEKFFKNLYMYGNTSAASIPIAISEMHEQGLLNGKKSLVCTGFGAGLTYAGMKITTDIKK